jgi:hypothetical protein
MDSSDALPTLSRIQTDVAGEVGYSPFTIGLTSLGQARSSDEQVHTA